MAANSCIDLGYAEISECFLSLQSNFFPSKCGGKPAWLSLFPLPEAVACSCCGSNCVFLCQIYCPDMRGIVYAFHRTIFIFTCTRPPCHSSPGNGCFRVLRSQLAKKNDFYTEVPPDLSDPHANIKLDIKFLSRNLCTVCGLFAGSKKCGKCKCVAYCSKDHQLLDWKKGGHKQSCGQENPTTCKPDDVTEDGSKADTKAAVVEVDGADAACGGEPTVSERGVEDACLYLFGKPSKLHDVLFDEYELSIETEDYLEEPKQEKEDNKKEMEKLKKYLDEQGRSANQLGDELDMDESVEDKQFRKFRKRIALAPEQWVCSRPTRDKGNSHLIKELVQKEAYHAGRVLRYQRGGVPLWVSSENMPSASDIPNCDNCGADRSFEFQILPQLLSYMNVDALGSSIDWGTLAVYTCSRSCDIGNQYREEFLWKQEFSATSVPNALSNITANMSLSGK